MPYIDRAGLEQRFGIDEIAQLLDDDRSGTELSTESESLTAAVADADAMIDGYLATRYALPLEAVPVMVAGWAADIARYRLWDEQAPEEVRRRYEDAIARLRDLAAGRIDLPPSAGGETVAGSAFASEGYCDERVFTAATLAGF